MSDNMKTRNVGVDELFDILYIDGNKFNKGAELVSSRLPPKEITICSDANNEIKQSIIFYDFLIKLSNTHCKAIEKKEDKLVFKSKLILKNITFEKEATFKNIDFEKEVIFKNIVFEKEVIFKDIIFEKEVIFKDIIFKNKLNEVTSDTEVKKGTIFEKVTFKESVDFKETEFNETSFNFVVFTGEADFKRAKFYDDISFEYTTFKKRGAFAGITLQKNISFRCLVLNDKSHIYFRNTTEDIDKKLYKNKKISICDTVINGRIDFNNNMIGIIDLSGSVVIGSGTLNMIKFDPKCEDYQTATILKNEEIKKNNIIKALEYKAEEKKLYAKDLYDKYLEMKKSPKNSDNKKWQNRFERLSIWLSKISNNHGQDWMKAVRFTFIGAFGCFLLFYCLAPLDISDLYYCLLTSLGTDLKECFNSCEIARWNNFIPEFFKYLIPTNYSLLNIYLDNAVSAWYYKALASSVYILGKIWVGYGIFEIIEAFRKFNKIS